MVGKFIGIGVGPGDPELITVKAVKALQAADYICVPKSQVHKPSMALGMIKQILKERQKPAEIVELLFPMTKDELNNRKLWGENAALVASKAKLGDVAFITLGDPMLYSTFLYLYEYMKETFPKLEMEIIPGVTSLTAALQELNCRLQKEKRLLPLFRQTFDPAIIEETARSADNLVFMKCAYRIKELIPILKKAGFTQDAKVALVKRCTLPKEKVRVGKLGDAENWKVTKITSLLRL